MRAQAIDCQPGPIDTEAPLPEHGAVKNKVGPGLMNDRRAVTALEYGIIAGVLGLVLISIFSTFGSRLSSLFNTIGRSI
jgi:Flp pilus assembly pilin Flp